LGVAFALLARFPGVSGAPCEDRVSAWGDIANDEATAIFGERKVRLQTPADGSELHSYSLYTFAGSGFNDYALHAAKVRRLHVGFLRPRIGFLARSRKGAGK
jgi:hypothetical protein